MGSPLGETVEKASFLGLTLSQLLARDYHLTIQGTSLEVCWSLAVAQIHSEPLVPWCDGIRKSGWCHAQGEGQAGPVQWGPGRWLVSILSIPWAGQGLHRTRAGPESRGGARRLAYQGLVVNLLADELVLTQRVAGFTRDGIDGPLLHLLLDGTEQREEGLPGTLLYVEESRAGRTQMCGGWPPMASVSPRGCFPLLCLDSLLLPLLLFPTSVLEPCLHVSGPMPLSVPLSAPQCTLLSLLPHQGTEVSPRWHEFLTSQ